MIEKLTQIPESRLTGDARRRLPGNVHFCFKDIDGRSLALLLQQEGICVSAGAACTSSDSTASHVLNALQVPESYSRGALRISLGAGSSRADILYVAQRIRENVEKLRGMQRKNVKNI